MFDDNTILEFFNGSQDGLVLQATRAPDFLEVKTGASKDWVEVYERQSEEAPFIYVQIGYVKTEQWK